MARLAGAMLRPPGGGTGLELSSSIRPGYEAGSPDPMHSELGLRNVTFEADDLAAILDRLAAYGYHISSTATIAPTWAFSHKITYYSCRK